MIDKEIIEYAIIGLSSEIDKSQLTIYRANNYICNLEEGKRVKTPKTIDELKELQNKGYVESILGRGGSRITQLGFEYLNKN